MIFCHSLPSRRHGERREHKKKRKSHEMNGADPKRDVHPIWLPHDVFPSGICRKAKNRNFQPSKPSKTRKYGHFDPIFAFPAPPTRFSGHFAAA